MSLYRTSEVDRIAREVVSEAMVDWALRVNYMNSGRRQGLRSKSNEEWLRNPARRAHARRNIAIGIQAGSYSIAQFEAEQALRARVLPLKYATVSHTGRG